MILQSAAEPTISRPDQLDDLQLRRCAELVFDAGRGYYDLIEAERGLVEVQIQKQLGQPGTELQNIFVALIDSNVAGLHACISSEVLPFVMMEGTLRLLRGFERGVRRSFLSRLQRARPFLPALPESSLYLARMAVSESYQGLWNCVGVDGGLLRSKRFQWQLLSALPYRQFEGTRLLRWVGLRAVRRGHVRLPGDAPSGELTLGSSTSGLVCRKQLSKLGHAQGSLNLSHRELDSELALDLGDQAQVIQRVPGGAGFRGQGIRHLLDPEFQDFGEDGVEISFRLHARLLPSRPFDVKELRRQGLDGRCDGGSIKINGF